MDVRYLRSQIEAALDGLIGTYILPNGRKVSSVAVLKRPDENFPPDGTQIKGLEVVIVYPRPITQQQLSQYRIEWQWQVYLKQWDLKESIHPAFRQILTLPGITQTLLIPAQESLGTPETISIIISDYEAVT